jgi:hypothetical protein
VTAVGGPARSSRSIFSIVRRSVAVTNTETRSNFAVKKQIFLSSLALSVAILA